MSYSDSLLSGPVPSDSSGGGSSIWASLIGAAGQVTNTAILSHANPVNAAILTNTPISTLGTTTGISLGTGTTSGLVVIGALVVVGILLVSAMRS